MPRKNNKVFLSFIILMISSCYSKEQNSNFPILQPTITVSQNIANYFPLNKDVYWVYQGNVKWMEINSPEVSEEEITWKMEVKRVFERNAVIGYEMIGGPWDLAWYENGKLPSEYGIVQAGGKFYRVPSDSILRIWNEDDDLFGLVNENNLLLEAPLVVGNKFCDSNSMVRPDGMYCWNVVDVQPFNTNNVQGINSSGDYWEYTIINQTMPDVSIIYFVPGIGISRYSYHHNGTISEVDVRLVEYFPGY